MTDWLYKTSHDLNKKKVQLWDTENNWLTSNQTESKYLDEIGESSLVFKVKINVTQNKMMCLLQLHYNAWSDNWSVMICLADIE